jgi:hypothetical protein
VAGEVWGGEEVKSGACPRNFANPPDLILYGKIVVELKALDRLTTREEAQLLNYLKATGLVGYFCPVSST